MTWQREGRWGRSGDVKEASWRPAEFCCVTFETAPLLSGCVDCWTVSWVLDWQLKPSNIDRTYLIISLLIHCCLHGFDVEHTMFKDVRGVIWNVIRAWLSEFSLRPRCCSAERPRTKSLHRFTRDVKQDWRQPSPPLNVCLSAAKVAVSVTWRKIMFDNVCLLQSHWCFQSSISSTGRSVQQRNVFWTTDQRLTPRTQSSR